MKRFAIAAGILAIGFLTTSPAGAADLWTPSVKDTWSPPPQRDMRTVTCQAKLHMAGQSIFNKSTATMASFEELAGAASLGFGGGLGCDLNLSGFVIGGFADYTWDKTDLTVLGSTASMPFGNEWSVGLRVGARPVAPVLIYSLAAYTGAEARTLSTSTASFSLAGPKGWAIGGGIEVDLTKKVTLGMEYRHINFDTTSNAALPVKFDTSENQARISLGYRLN